MPHLRKEFLSQYIRSGCDLQLRINLSKTDDPGAIEVPTEALPLEQPPRPGLEILAQAGEEWEQAKYADLIDAFGRESIVADIADQHISPPRVRAAQLDEALTNARPGTFLLQHEFPVVPDLAIRLSGQSSIRLTYSKVRPDIIEVLEPYSTTRAVMATGETSAIAQGDTRLQLRIIDIKLTAEPSPAYFAEVAYYCVALSAWLSEIGLSEHFIVSTEAAVWPGSHEASPHLIGRTGAASLRSIFFPAEAFLPRRRAACAGTTLERA